VLTTADLSYFESETAKKPSGVIPVSSITNSSIILDDKYQQLLSLATDGRVFWIRTADPTKKQYLEDWNSVLNSILTPSN
jgi:hypothetical protein